MTTIMKRPNRASFLVLVSPNGKTIMERSDKHSAFHAIGGKADGDETPLDTLLREVREEIGFELDPEAIIEARSSIVAYGHECWEETYYVVHMDYPRLIALAKHAGDKFVLKQSWLAISQSTLTCAGRQALMIAIESL